jgi:1-acyl-sn-glycerol-3-phosphate acyltransferase
MVKTCSDLDPDQRIDHSMNPINLRLWSAAYCVANALFPPFFKIKASGTDQIPSKKGFILLPKHQRWQDIPLLGMSAGRPLYYVAKYELFRYPVVCDLLKSLGGIPLNRKRPVNTRWSLRAVIKALKSGHGIALFPEGTYFYNRLGQGRSGMLRYILKHIQVPLIPVGIQYGPFQLRQEVCIRFGAPIKELYSSDLMDQIMAAIGKLSGLIPDKIERN